MQLSVPIHLAGTVQLPEPTQWNFEAALLRTLLKTKTGSRPFDIDWNHWLARSAWTSKEAVLLVFGFNPILFHETESRDDYYDHCQPINKMLALVPEQTHSPAYWLTLFKDGYLEEAPRFVREWQAAHEIVITPAPFEKGRRGQQIAAIVQTAIELGYNPLDIPVGRGKNSIGKKAIKEICLKNTQLFTESGFDRAWREGDRCGLIRVQGKENYQQKQ